MAFVALSASIAGRLFAALDYIKKQNVCSARCTFGAMMMLSVDMHSTKRFAKACALRWLVGAGTVIQPCFIQQLSMVRRASLSRVVGGSLTRCRPWCDRTSLKGRKRRVAVDLDSYGKKKWESVLSAMVDQDNSAQNIGIRASNGELHCTTVAVRCARVPVCSYMWAAYAIPGCTALVSE